MMIDLEPLIADRRRPTMIKKEFKHTEIFLDK